MNMHWILLYSSVLAAPGSPGAAYFAETRPDRSVHLTMRSGSSENPVPGAPEGVEWRPIRLRAASPEIPEGAGGVLELEDPIPRLQVRADFQLFAFSGIATDSSGLGVVGPSGVSLLLSSDDNRYRIFNDGAALSTGGTHLAVALRGSVREEIHVLDVRGRTPVLQEVVLPDDADRIEPGSLSVTISALFFGARSEKAWSVYRAPLVPNQPGNGPIAERVAGPFGILDAYFAASVGGVVFLAGEGSGELDVFVVPNSGAAINVTRSPGPFLPHTPGEPRLAVSGDVRSVAYDLRMGGEPETFLHDVERPGPAGAFQITADQRFNPYIDHESLIFFDGNGNLVFAGGHDVVTTDVFRVQRIQPDSPINLTRTGSSFYPPFLTKGTLAVGTLRLAPGGLALVSATGFPGSSSAQPLLAAADIATGELRFTDVGLESPSGIVSTGSALLFAASPPGGGRAFYKMAAGDLTQIGVATAGSEPRTLLLAGGAAVVALPGTGIVSLEQGEPRLLSPAPEPITSADLDASGRYLAYGRGGVSAAEYVVVDLTTGEETPLAQGTVGGEMVALAEDLRTFLRGDSNLDGELDISDPVSTLFYLFLGEATLPCLDAADADDDGTLSITDGVRTLLYLFRGGEALPEPSSRPGLDPTPDTLDCGT